jgi:NitT/TauT family transport system ATP-binding protein
VKLGRRILLLSSRPGRIIDSWDVDLADRRLESPPVAALSAEITTALRTEIRRHAA